MPTRRFRDNLLRQPGLLQRSRVHRRNLYFARLDARRVQVESGTHLERNVLESSGLLEFVRNVRIPGPNRLPLRRPEL
jgi:hypothetical protein